MADVTPCHAPNSRVMACYCGLVHRWAKGQREFWCHVATPYLNVEPARPWKPNPCRRHHVRGAGYVQPVRLVQAFGDVKFTGIERNSKRRPACEGVQDGG